VPGEDGLPLPGDELLPAERHQFLEIVVVHGRKTTAIAPGRRARAVRRRRRGALECGDGDLDSGWDRLAGPRVRAPGGGPWASGDLPGPGAGRAGNRRG